MKTQFDNTKRCKPSGITLHKDSYHKHNKSEKCLPIRGEKQKVKHLKKLVWPMNMTTILILKRV